MNNRPSDDDITLVQLGFRVIGTFDLNVQPTPLPGEDVIAMSARLAEADYDRIIRNHVPGHWIVGHEPKDFFRHLEEPR